MSAQIELGELHRLSTDEYHRLIEVGASEVLPRVELIDGLLVRKDMKTREHENAIAWLARWLMLGVDHARYAVRIAGPLTLEGSEPEPDLAVIAHAAPQPYHFATAALVVEVSVSSLRRDLNRKAALYAQAGVSEYWVVDVAGRRVVVHRAPGPDGYAEIAEVRPGGRVDAAAIGLDPLAVDELLLAADG